MKTDKNKKFEKAKKASLTPCCYDLIKEILGFVLLKDLSAVRLLNHQWNKGVFDNDAFIEVIEKALCGKIICISPSYQMATMHRKADLSFWKQSTYDHSGNIVSYPAESRFSSREKRIAAFLKACDAEKTSCITHYFNHCYPRNNWSGATYLFFVMLLPFILGLVMVTRSGSRENISERDFLFIGGMLFVVFSALILCVSGGYILSQSISGPPPTCDIQPSCCVRLSSERQASIYLGEQALSLLKELQERLLRKERQSADCQLRMPF